MNGPIRHMATAIFLVFALLAGAVTYQQLIVGPDYRDDPRNARLLAGRAGRERGTIITADGVVVATSEADPDDPRVFRRIYPEDGLYAHVVGYATQLFGSAGLENAWADQLLTDRDATISGVINAMMGDDLRPRGLRLTIDHDLQQTAAEALGDQLGAVVAMDPATGAILALVSNPTFDPNSLLGTGAGPFGTQLDEDPTQPLLNRAVAETYAPGSTFKIITTTAALETGQAGPGTSYPDPVELELPGSTSTIRNFNRRVCTDGDTVTLAEAFRRSCNTTFAQIGIQLDALPLVAAAESYGFNLEIPLDLRVVASTIPGVATFADDLPGVAQTAIGQRDVRATPLQMALVGAAVANGGEIMEPHLVAEVFNADAEIQSEAEPAVWRRAMSPATAAVIAEMMEDVVANGTGGNAAVEGVQIAGKTGTAQVPDSAPHAWFVGYGSVGAAPDEQQIVVAVLVESGGDAGEDATGGSVAAPIAKAVFQEFFGVTPE